MRALSGALSHVPSRESIEVGPDAHVTDALGSFVNHATGVRATVGVDRAGRRLVAARDIAVGEEITFDYNQNETKTACRFRTASGEWVVGIKGHR